MQQKVYDSQSEQHRTEDCFCRYADCVGCIHLYTTIYALATFAVNREWWKVQKHQYFSFHQKETKINWFGNNI